jgi:hypothetical protein
METWNRRKKRNENTVFNNYRAEPFEVKKKNKKKNMYTEPLISRN